MTKKNYVYLLIGLIILALWGYVMLSVFDHEKLFLSLQYIYIGIGWAFALGFLIAGFTKEVSEDESLTKVHCDRCDKRIKKAEKSLHFFKKEVQKDYCEKCKHFIITDKL